MFETIDFISEEPISTFQPLTLPSLYVNRHYPACKKGHQYYTPSGATGVVTNVWKAGFWDNDGFRETNPDFTIVEIEDSHNRRDVFFQKDIRPVQQLVLLFVEGHLLEMTNKENPRKKKCPDSPKQLLELYKKLGNQHALAQHYNIAINTLRRWLTEARPERKKSCRKQLKTETAAPFGQR